MKKQPKLFACVIRQYGTGLYRACVRLGKDHLVYLGTHQNEASAEEAMNRFLEAQRSGEMKTAEEIAAFANSINSPPLSLAA
ncbi:MAG: hypothetical protein ACREEM_08370 [Blastocatellia bacterium]